MAPDPNDPSGNPQLMCGYRARDASNKEISNTAITSVPIISGVEVFQVLYGVDTNNDYIPDRYLLLPRMCWPWPPNGKPWCR
ncbi:PilW family protein [Cupriavidus basilensis]